MIHSFLQQFFSTQKRPYFVCISLLFFLSTTWMWQKSNTESPKPYVATVVVKIPIGEEKYGIKRFQHIPYLGQPGLSVLTGLLPVDVSDDDSVYLLNGSKLFTFSPEGKLVHQVDFPWTTPASMMLGRIRRGSDDTLWVTDSPTQRSQSRLIKVTTGAEGVWEMGEFSSARSASLSASRLPHPPKYDARKASFGPLHGLYVDKKGEVSVLLQNEVMRHFSKEGQFLREDNLAKKSVKNELVGFSAITAADGRSFSLMRRLKGLELQETLNLNVFGPKGRASFDIKWDLPDVVQDVVLINANVTDKIYIGYTYRFKNGETVRPGFWNGPMAIAEINLVSRKISKIFDVYDYYGKRAEIANEARTKSQNLGVFGVGNLLKVNNNGDLYFEVADATHYRIEKIAFPKVPNSR